MCPRLRQAVGISLVGEGVISAYVHACSRLFHYCNSMYVPWSTICVLGCACKERLKKTNKRKGISHMYSFALSGRRVTGYIRPFTGANFKRLDSGWHVHRCIVYCITSYNDAVGAEADKLKSCRYWITWYTLRIVLICVLIEYSGDRW